MHIGPFLYIQDRLKFCWSWSVTNRSEKSRVSDIDITCGLKTTDYKYRRLKPPPKKPFLSSATFFAATISNANWLADREMRGKMKSARFATPLAALECAWFKTDGHTPAPSSSAPPPPPFICINWICILSFCHKTSRAPLCSTADKYIE